MKKTVFFIVVLVLCTAMVGSEEILKFNNTECPFMHSPVNGKRHVVYNGIQYEVCCRTCEDIFMSDPAKNIEKFPNKGVIVDLNNTTCPVTGSAATAENIFIYNGNKIHFCSPECISVFEKDPKKYPVKS